MKNANELLTADSFERIMISKLRSKIEKILKIPVEECEKYFVNYRILLKIEKKDFFIKEGEVCAKIAFVVKGVFRMFYISPEGKEINTHFFFDNDFVASYQSFLTQSKSKYFIQALENCELLTVSYESLQNAYSQSLAWQQFGRIIAEKVFSLTNNEMKA